MAKNTTVSLTLQIKGNAGAELKRISDQQVQSTAKLNQQWTQINGAQARFVNTAQAGTRATMNTARAGDQVVRTNRLLVQIMQQQQRQSNLMTQQLRQQERSYQVQVNSLRSQVREAERLRQQLEAAGRAGRNNPAGTGFGGNIIGGTAATVGGTVAAGMIGANYLKDPREYMKQISLATDTVLAGQKMSLPEFNKKITQMESFVRSSAVKGGSTPQQMVQSLNTLTASNVYDFNELKDVMYQVSKTAFAGGADANDVALMTIAQKNFGLKDLKRANDQAMKAGQLGSFELRDMARYMPDLLTQGKGAGYIGDKGYRDLLTMMQLSKKTAGTAEGAAVNLSDLLGSFSQYHLGLSFAKHIKVEKGDPIAAYGVSKKRSGFDWTTYAANMREKGIGEVEAAALLMNRQMEKSPLYQKYRNKANDALKSGNNSEYLENVQAATQIAAQSEIGKIFHNKQALMAFMGITMNMSAGGFKEQLDQGILDSAGTIDISHQRQAAQEYGKDSSLDTARFNARVDNYNGVAGWLGDLKQGVADFASSNAGVAAAASAAVVGLTAVAAAGGVAAIAMGGGAQGGLLKKAGGAVLRGGGAVATGAGALIGSPIGQVAIAGGVGYGIGTATRNMYMRTETGQKFDDKMGEAITKTLAFFGNEDAKAAVEAQAKYDQMIAEQQNQTQVLASKLDNGFQMMATSFANNKPVINLSTSSPFSQSTNKEEKRHGAAVPWSLAAK